MNYFLGDQERDLIKVCVLLHIKGEVSRFSGMLINQNAFFNAGTDCIVHASDMIMSVLSKNQSAHSSGSHLINLCANNCKFINYRMQPSGRL